MKIILKQTIDTLGQEGDIVKVKPGYARNYLFPTQKAVAVNAASEARLEREKQNIASRLAAQKQQADTLAAKLADKTVVISKRVGDEQRLFGSVTAQDIATALEKEGVKLERRAIILPEAIKTLGEYKITVKTGYQSAATLLVQVAPENTGAAA